MCVCTLLNADFFNFAHHHHTIATTTYSDINTRIVHVVATPEYYYPQRPCFRPLRVLCLLPPLVPPPTHTHTASNQPHTPTPTHPQSTPNLSLLPLRPPFSPSHTHPARCARRRCVLTTKPTNHPTIHIRIFSPHARRYTSAPALAHSHKRARRHTHTHTHMNQAHTGSRHKYYSRSTCQECQAT